MATPGKSTSEFKLSLTVFLTGAVFTAAGILCPPLIPALALTAPALIEVGGTLMASAGVGYAVSRGLAKGGK